MRNFKLEKQTLDLLDFDNILKALSSCAASPGGAALIYNQDFDTDAEELRYKKNLVSDWKELLQSDLKRPDTYFPEINFIRKLKKKGTVLEGLELADSANFIKSSIFLKKYCAKIPDNLKISGCLAGEAEKIIDLNNYADSIFKEINNDGAVREDHPLLRNARGRIAALHKKLNSISAAYLNDDRDIWQSAVPSQRDGRTVLALKSNYRGRIKGIIHEVSSSGATVFIEPLDIVELNNDLACEQSQLNQQTVKIYRSLTEQLREAADLFENLVLQINMLDTYYARAVYSIKNRCIRPQEQSNGIRIVEGRHPMLGKKAVPISLNYSDEVTILIITGPNAGGKTVTLKTCGLFVLLNQFACELPAKEGTSIGIYENVFADIGDDQSIEQSLSTFSGHMSRIADIINHADGQSLVLLDELGSGTDPVQGSAIAMAILKKFKENKISTIITTHHAAVKNFGYTYEGAVNASVAFDTVSMKPTYRIIEGVPGESHAIEIAQSCGISGDIIKDSEEYLERGDSAVSGIIKELESRQNDILKRERLLEEAEERNREARRGLDLLKLKLKQQEHILKTEGYNELKKYVNNSKKELENLVREIREGEITREKTKRVKNFIKESDKKVNEISSEIEKEEHELSGINTDDGFSDFMPGMKVRHRKNKKTGTIIEKRRDDEWIVAFGNIRLNVGGPELEYIESPPEIKHKVSVSSSGINVGVSFELDLRGMRAYEAENALLKQLDSALLSGVNSFSIIHGLGEGVLQRTVHDFLGECDAVKDFSYSDPEHGGYGKTIVRLK